MKQATISKSNEVIDSVLLYKDAETYFDQHYFNDSHNEI